ncbi:MAG TPA: tetratricopeptide repeat protein [Longimicrobiales bacterium]|nr:tetratricopeptide repeat protein [Longimicrobiales bacterium]
MIDANRAIQPLRDAERAIAKLQDYESTAELASAVQAPHAAVQKSLRYLLRADKGAPDDLRLLALSPTELAPDRLIPALRQRNLISLDLAGQIHELDGATKRSETGSARAADGDLALRVVDQLRTEIQSLGERSMREVAHTTVESGPLDDVHTVPPHSRNRSIKKLAIFAFIAGLLTVLIVVMVMGVPGGKNDCDALYNKGDYSKAEQACRRVVEKNPGNASAAYYLSILYRKSNRHEDAGKVLQRAIEKNPKDPYLREELGNLFMDLDQPEIAVKHFRMAQEINPNEPRYWVKLVAALRAAGDPEADAVAARAPEEARAMLRTAQ